MTARKRKDGESFEDYRASIKYDSSIPQIGRLIHKSVEFYKDAKKGAMKRTQTFRDGRNARKRDKKLQQQYAKRG